MLRSFRLAPDSTDRNHILRQLESIQVFSSDNLVLRRHVIVDGQKIFGKDENGRVVLQWTETVTHIYFSTDTVTSGLLPWHFVAESLLNILEIPGERHSLLVSILYTQDYALMEDLLERAGLLENAEALTLSSLVMND